MLEKIINQFDNSISFLSRMDYVAPHADDDGRELSLPFRDLTVVCVSIPMFIGIADWSGMPPSSGLLAGIIGGLLVGLLSGSHTNITGPSARLTIVVSGILVSVGSVDGLELAVLLADLIQIGFAALRLGVC
jgi:carbonic anhydrase/SulP family sulfate permease